ncbi:MAG: glycosyltransferase [Kiritimatiellae bacterium]|nr:glycosyltransferase [Kiritimatiellia bacterium]
MPLISLITVCRNSAATIRTAMESVLAQESDCWEYIIVDGSSSDGTLAIIQELAPKFGSRMRWISEPDSGMYDAMNKGISLARGAAIGILNADDLLESPSTLSLVSSAFTDDVDAVYADVRFVKSDLSTTVRHYGSKHWKPWMLQWGKMPPHPSIYIRREHFSSLGGYKTDYEIAADYELVIRHLRTGHLRAKYLPATLVRMRMGGKSTRSWRSNLLINKETVRANRENGYFCCMPMLLPKYLFKIWEFAIPLAKRLLRR